MKKFTNDIKKDISKLVINNDIEELKTYLNKLVTSINKYAYNEYDKNQLKPGSNEYNIIKFLNWLELTEDYQILTSDGIKTKKRFNKNLPYNIFKIGNSKLPFLNFSTLPGETCPGAGSCLNYCYSFKAWRYPASFFSQCQNTLLMINNFKTIENELNKILSTNKFKNMTKIDFRLYVDGDFNNFQDLINWMELLKKLPQISAYGYSKSLNLFLSLSDENYQFPNNYVLNLSNGGVFDSLHKFLIKLPFVRGNFEGLNIKKDTKLSEIKKTYPNKKVFLCPGVCGSCTKIGHACGNLDTFKDYSIIIPIH